MTSGWSDPEEETPVLEFGSWIPVLYVKVLYGVHTNFSRSVLTSTGCRDSPGRLEGEWAPTRRSYFKTRN